MPASISLARSNALWLPPHIKASVPAVAAATPPETGVSIKSIPSLAAASPTSRAVVASIVLASSINVSVGTCASKPLSPKNVLATCLPAGNILIITSASDTASSADVATKAPSAASAAHASATRSKTVSVCPAAIRFLAMGPPILPSPKNAICAMIYSGNPSAGMSAGATKKGSTTSSGTDLKSG